MRKVILIYAFTLLSLNFATCAVTPANIFVGVTADKSVYKPQESLALALTVLNKQSKSVQLIFPSSQRYDFYLYDGEQIIWKWSADKMFAMALTNLKLEPKLPQTYVVKVTPQLASGQPLTPGKYQLVGVLCAKNKIYSKPITIEFIK